MGTNNWVKITLTTLALVVAVSILTGGVDEKGQSYTDQALTRSLVTFGVARALNGVISVAQGTEVALQPAGVGLTFTPGQILDPINDLVERFSWVMLLSSASLGILKTLLVISAWPWFTGITVVVLIAALGLMWWPRTPHQPVNRLLLKLALLLVVLRLGVPVVAICSEWVYQGFLAPQYEQATLQLQETTDNIGKINEETMSETSAVQDESLLGSARRLYQSASCTLDIEARLERYKEAAADASRYLVDLIVVFLFQTVILPLLFIFTLYSLMKLLIRWQPGDS